MKTLFNLLVGVCMAWPAPPACEQWADEKTGELLTQSEAISRDSVICQVKSASPV